MLVIQEIIIEWCKSEQIFKELDFWKKIPLAFLLPAINSKVIDYGCMHQRFYMCNLNRYTDSGTVDFKKFNNEAVIGCAFFRQKNNALDVFYKYDEKSGGAPRQHFRDQTGTWIPVAKKAFVLHENQWGRLIYNGRFSMEDEWLYRKTFVNVAWGCFLKEDIFIGSEPFVVYENLVKLW